MVRSEPEQHWRRAGDWNCIRVTEIHRRSTVAQDKAIPLPYIYPIYCAGFHTDNPYFQVGAYAQLVYLTEYLLIVSPCVDHLCGTRHPKCVIICLELQINCRPFGNLSFFFCYPSAVRCRLDGCGRNFQALAIVVVSKICYDSLVSPGCPMAERYNACLVISNHWTVTPRVRSSP